MVGTAVKGTGLGGVHGLSEGGRGVLGRCVRGGRGGEGVQIVVRPFL